MDGRQTLLTVYSASLGELINFYSHFMGNKVNLLEVGISSTKKVDFILLHSNSPLKMMKNAF